MCDPRLAWAAQLLLSSLLEELLISTQKSVCEYKAKLKNNMHICEYEYSCIQSARHYRAKRDKQDAHP